MSMAKRPNGKWRARYRNTSGREHSRHFDRKADAERWLNSVKNSIARGEWIDPASAKVSVGDWATRWIGNQVRLKPQIFPVWERVELSAITHADVGEWIRRMSEAGL
ncbi:hypothetical protein [Actinoplanes aureus]|uniref:Phage L5-like integrase N-terminal domain-containing protein n=1 Tax=Actinoplanes aureus TaxID=2792083 RepID=A0A931CGF8_9ACTN|nr:hypothetical protein [Actinoplanes aureus]MBG0565668.1 hypothetical protein [Actinoplanes aureus]